MKTTTKFSRRALENEIIEEGRSLYISEEATAPFAKKVATEVATWVKKRGKVTESDVNIKVAKSIKKYSKDLAFIYENRDKII